MPPTEASSMIKASIPFPEQFLYFMSLYIVAYAVFMSQNDPLH
jgi:hypothetical protein